ncbi:MAG: hypothetical protein MUE78_03980 [Ilumatobacteraceae bacterium]|nr:hypothetical protein [Ilumatobacteraceae bacterium]
MGSLRAPFVAGVVMAVVAMAAGGAAVAVATGDNRGTMGLLLVPVLLVLVAIANLVVGFFGRDHEWGLLAAIGIGTTLTLALAVAVVARWDGIGTLAILVIGPALGGLSGAVGRIAWFVGDFACAMSGRPTNVELVAEPDLTLATAGLDEVAERHAPGEPVLARAVGVQVGRLRYRRVGVVATEQRLVIAPLGEHAGDDVVVIDADALARASIRSEAADGTTRRTTNVVDDAILVEPRGRAAVTFVLPYDPPKADVRTGIGGPAELREWIRRHTAAYE